MCQQVSVPVCVFAFDALYADGEVLVGLPLRERRARMKQVPHSLVTAAPF